MGILPSAIRFYLFKTIIDIHQFVMCVKFALSHQFSRLGQNKNTVCREFIQYLVLHLIGGTKKRKKKTYTKPKRKKHLHKKIELGILNYFKVIESSLIRLRKQCPLCGPGIFMALHSDRYHCGNCRVTINDECACG